MLTRVVVSWLLLMTQTAPVERAYVFPRDDDATTPLFTFERVVSPTSEGTVAEVRFRDAAGDVAAVEQVTYAAGTVTRYELVQYQVDARYTMTVNGDQAVFESERKGELSRTRRDWTADTLTIDELRPFVSTHWDRLMQGETIRFRLVALDRARIIDFRLTRKEIVTYQNEPAVALRMEASRLFIRWLAPEVDLFFTPDGETLLESRGPLPLKLRAGNEWIDLDARMVWR
ncbi:MAG: hypothetical protein VYE68_13710 [Acidobacteriota bacterium]|nr:hypothetical protein [Acidobacteriota bacterium]